MSKYVERYENICACDHKAESGKEGLAESKEERKQTTGSDCSMCTS